MVGGLIRGIYVLQVGDQLDRGDEELQILVFLKRLESEAREAGGALHVLNGNHETMNVAGRFTYATPPAMSDFLQWHSLARLDAALRVPLPLLLHHHMCFCEGVLSQCDGGLCVFTLLWCLSQEKCGKKASPYTVPPLPTEHRQYAHIQPLCWT